MNRMTYLNQFRVLTDSSGAPAEIRRHGASVTYKAEDLRSGDEVGLEIIPLGDFSPENITDLEAEAAAAKELSHVNVPGLYGFGCEGETAIYASKYFDGTTAEDWVATHGPMPVGPALRIGVQVVSTLGAATFHGIVHGGINPRNILLVPGQTAQGDWPLVKILGLVGPPPRFTGSQFAAAAPDFAAQFASPEQLQNGMVDFRSEIYSLGATLWFLLTGAPPDDAGDLPRVSGLPKPVMQLIEEMLARNPNDRPHDPVLFEERIRGCLESAERREAIGRKFGVTVAPPAPVVRTDERRAFPWRPLTVAALVLLFAGLAFAFWPGRTPRTTMDGKSDQPIGVPVGVPEEASGPVAVPTATAAAVAENIATPAPTAPVPQIPVEPPPRVVAAASPPPAAVESEAAAPPEIEPTPEPTIAVAEATPPIERAAESAARPPVVLRRAPTPGPTEEELASASQSRVTEERAPVEDEPERAEPVVVENAPSRTEPIVRNPEPTINGLPVRRAEPVLTEPVYEAPPVARAIRRPRRINGLEVRVAEPAENTPGLPNRSRRARFIGTTPEGELVFETPSQERGYVSPRR